MPSPEASRRNLQDARNRGQIKLRRSLGETQLIKLLVWQSWWEEPRPSQRALARQLRVSQPYICKTMRKAQTVGMDALLKHGRVTLDDLDKAQQVTARIREREPDLFAPEPQRSASDEPRALTADESITQRWREVQEWKRKNPCYDSRRRIRVPIPR